jgi:hypothetical protein
VEIERGISSCLLKCSLKLNGGKYGVQSKIRRAFMMALPLCHSTENTVGKFVKKLPPSGDDEPNKTQQQLN